MKSREIKVKSGFISLVIVCVLLAGVFLPMTQAKTNVDYVSGFDKGPSNLPVVPMKKVGMIKFDKDTLLDDFAFLSSIPAAVFKENDRLYSYPLL